jgi:hypothetical protein
MPKAGETPEMGANPMLGFGRVYARPELAKTVDRRVRRLFNEPGHTFEQFHEWLQSRGITLWGAAVDTLENTSRFADGRPTGPMAVFHLFDSPLRLSRPYESYMGCLTVPTAVAQAAENAAVLLDYRTPRKLIVEAIEAAYRGIRRENIHVWTLRGKSRVHRLGRLWEEWEKAGVHLVEDGWKAPSGLAVFTDSGTYAPTFLVGSWTDSAGVTHVFLTDGYAATAEALQAASLADVLDVHSTMSLFSPSFELPGDVEGRLMQFDPSAPEFAQRLTALIGRQHVDAGKVRTYAEAIQGGGGVQHATRQAGAPRRRLPAGQGLVGGGQCRLHVRRPLHGRARRHSGGPRRLPRHHPPGYQEGVEPDHLHPPAHGAVGDHAPGLQPAARALPLGRRSTTRPVKISDSGRIRNELQTMIPQALEHDGERILVRFERINEMVMSRDNQARIRAVLQWYKASHPSWFEWLEPV